MMATMRKQRRPRPWQQLGLPDARLEFDDDVPEMVRIRFRTAWRQTRRDVRSVLNSGQLLLLQRLGRKRRSRKLRALPQDELLPQLTRITAALSSAISERLPRAVRSKAEEGGSHFAYIPLVLPQYPGSLRVAIKAVPCERDSSGRRLFVVRVCNGPDLLVSEHAADSFMHRCCAAPTTSTDSGVEFARLAMDNSMYHYGTWQHDNGRVRGVVLYDGGGPEKSDLWELLVGMGGEYSEGDVAVAAYIPTKEMPDGRHLALTFLRPGMTGTPQYSDLLRADFDSDYLHEAAGKATLAAMWDTDQPEARQFLCDICKHSWLVGRLK